MLNIESIPVFIGVVDSKTQGTAGKDVLRRDNRNSASNLMVSARKLHKLPGLTGELSLLHIISFDERGLCKNQRYLN